ncbi:NYN domain-containing protein [Ornithinimicrobium sp. Y1694]|uniref:NYN domain-containing protein n=1 Tax=Ornithinimicrobium sp. Y1694 TaxID=3418590 RepID=UPI003CF5A549
MDSDTHPGGGRGRGTDSSSTRIAVLIDCDNVSARHAQAVLEELATYGSPTVKRAYGDWTTTQLSGWKSELHRHAISPVQQFAYTTGKNSSDSALIIDAMDLLWQGNVEAFALVSSDSDFTRLATRLRESGKKVYGLGQRKTPESLRRAVDQFIFLEVLQENARETEEVTEATDDGEGDDIQGTRINLQSALTKAVNATSGDDGWAGLGAVGQHLNRAHADFDPRDFGHQKLSSLVDEQPWLETRTSGSHRQVRLKSRSTGRSTAKKTTATRSTSKTATAKRKTSTKGEA